MTVSPWFIHVLCQKANLARRFPIRKNFSVLAFFCALLLKLLPAVKQALLRKVLLHRCVFGPLPWKRGSIKAGGAATFSLPQKALLLRKITAIMRPNGAIH